MKFNIQIDMTPEEARRFMGLPDVAPLQGRMLAEMERRMKAAVDTSDPEAMLKAWMPLGGQIGAQGFEQFQRFMWDAARTATGTGKKEAPKSGR